MKKIIIAILLVFSCGILALTIPKSASAYEVIDLKNDDDSMSSYLRQQSHTITFNTNDVDQLTGGDYYIGANGFNFKITNIYYHVNYYSSWHIVVLTFDYCYWFNGMDYVITGLFDYGVGAVDIDTGLTTDIQSFIDSNLPKSLDIYLEFEYEQLSMDLDNYTYSIYLYSELYYGEGENSTLIADHFTTENVLIPISANLHNQYDYITNGFDFTPTILLYAYLYSNDKLAYTYPTYIDEDIDFLGFIQNATTGFLETEIIGTISIADILLFIVSIALLIFLLRFFAGG